jgi:hypothetical protein
MYYKEEPWLQRVKAISTDLFLWAVHVAVARNITFAWRNRTERRPAHFLSQVWRSDPGHIQI